MGRKKGKYWSILKAIFVLLIILAVAFFIWKFGGDLIKKIGDRINNFFGNALVEYENKETVQKSTKNVATGEELISSSFSDLFSGTGWIDYQKSNLYQDLMATSFSFKPILDIQKEDGENSSDFEKLYGNGVEKKCIENRCIFVSNKSLYSNGNLIELPNEINKQNLKNVSVGALTNKFVVGVVERDGGLYKGLIYFFDGEKFSLVFGADTTPFVSEYEGALGFGGEDNNWLAVYGGYRGLAYVFRSDKEPEGVSKFFQYKIMDGGFDPEILTTGDNGNIWQYIYSKEDGNPRFIKVLLSPEQKISGIFDLTDYIKNIGVRILSLSVAQSDENSATLEAVVENKTGEIEKWKIKDDAFEKSEKANLVSVNLNNYKAVVKSAVVSEAEFSAGESDVKFYLSNDGENWLPAKVGNEVAFQNKNGDKLFWKAEITTKKSASNFYSPFFDKIRVDYKTKSL